MRKYLLPILELLIISAPIYPCWYRGASFGVSYLKVDDMRKRSFFLKDDGFCANLFTGYEFENFPVRFEQQISVGKHYFDSYTIWGRDSYKKDFPLYSLSLTENVIVDLELENVTPYVGVGVGYQWAKAKGMTLILDEDCWDYGEWYKYKVRIKKFVFQSIFGVKKAIRDDMDVSLECRIKFSNDRKVKENGIFLGIRSYL